MRLSLAGKGQSLADKSFPFSVVNDSAPVTRLVEASLVTDAGSVIKKVFCLLPRDRYLFKKDELQPVTNIDIDTAWQQTFSFHHSEADGSPKTLFSCQINAKGGLNLLSSLFYCRTKQLFFHPPCPKCGIPLQLCKDDNLLILSGLQPFSNSLKRYLYCNICSSQGAPEFYINELDHTDPSTLKDRWSLIKEFGLVHESKDPVAIFPCPRCPERDTCYGPGCEAHSRVVPFSFYPFYFLIFEAPSLFSMDFPALVSGAPVDELAKHLASRNLSGGNNCLKEVKRQGLSGEMKAVREVAVSDGRDNDAAVHKTLIKIIDKWQGRSKTAATPEINEAIIDMTETLILPPAQPCILPPPPLKGEEFTETVILSSKTAGSGRSDSLHPGTSDEFAAETVIISPEMRRKEIFEATKTAEADGLTETIILASPQIMGRVAKDING